MIRLCVVSSSDSKHLKGSVLLPSFRFDILKKNIILRD